MSTKNTKCRRNKTIFNGTTTVVYADTFVKTDSELDQISAKLHDALTDLCLYTIETKGVAKLSPEDSYDETTGVTVASQKAELRANRFVLGRVHKARALAERYIKVLDSVADELNERYNHVKSIKR